MDQITPNDGQRSDNPNDQPTVMQVPGEKAAQALATGIQAVAGGPRLEVGPVPLTRVAEYELLKEIGRGGMGVVFKARHVRLNRIVALKMIRGGALANSDERQRFEKEAAAAAQLQHPNIVALYEVSNYDEQPFLSMEYIGGTSLAERLSLGPLSGRRAAEYLELTARAVHYAHSRGIVHRDLKPANVLLDEHDQPKVTDFGLAKHMETQSDQTRTGAILGTPSYMSPEQANGSKLITPSSDIYSLGAILYELITGKPPFCGDTPLATLNLVVEQDPIPPRVLSPGVDRDLETICLKCLEKNPDRRYQSADSLADDLHRYLNGDPIAARRVGPLGRSVKWIRRNPAWTSLSAFMFLSVLTFMSYSWYRAYQERDLREQAEGAKIQAMDAKKDADDRFKAMRLLFYLSEMRQAQHTLRRADFEGTMRILSPRWQPREGERDPRDWEWYFLKERAEQRLAFDAYTPGQASAVAYHPDGHLLATAGGEIKRPNEIKVWDLVKGKVKHTLRGHGNVIKSLAFHPGKQQLASASDDKTVKIWDLEAGTEIATLRDHEDSVHQVAFAPKGDRLASASHDGWVRLWNLSPIQKEPTKLKHDGPVTAVAFHPEGQLIAFAAHVPKMPGVIRFWNPATGVVEPTLTGHEDEVLSIAFSADGATLVSGGGGRDRGEVFFWDITSGKRTMHQALSGRIVDVAMCRDGQIAAAGNDGVLRIWTHIGASQALSLRADPRELIAVAFAPDGHSLATAGKMGRVSLWNSSGGSESLTLPTAGTIGTMNVVAFHPRDSFLAAAGVRGDVNVWDLKWPDRPIELKGTGKEVFGLAFAPDGNRIAWAGDDKVIRIADFRRRDLPTLALEGHTERVSAIAFHPNGSMIASAGGDEVIRIWDPSDGKLLRVLSHPRDILCLAFSPDGRWLASAGYEKIVRVWDVKTGENIAALEGHGFKINALSFGPDPNEPMLASASTDKTIRIWNIAKRELAFKLEGTPATVQSLAYHPHGRRLVSLGQDRLIRIWDLVTKQEILEFEEHLGNLRAVAFSPDGRSLAAAGAGVVRVWQASPEILVQRR